MEEKFIDFMINNGLSENSYKSYANDIKIFMNYYYDSYGEELHTLIRGDVLMYISFLVKNNYSPTSINRKISALKKYNLFLIQEKIQNNIVINEKYYIKIQNTMIQKTIPNLQEINKLKHFASKDTKHPARDYCILCIFIYGGLRESELVNLRLVDVKLEERFINIIGKGNKFRQVIINKTMYDALSEYLEERNKIETKNPYLFIGQKNKNTMKPLYRNFCNNLLNNYREICKIENLHPHMLRTFFCSNALHNAGYSIEQVANQAGHSSLNTTRRYLVSGQEKLISLADKL